MRGRSIQNGINPKLVPPLFGQAQERFKGGMEGQNVFSFLGDIASESMATPFGSGW